VNADIPPEISLVQKSAQPLSVAGHWRIVWRLQNFGKARLQINSARLPHGQFKAGERRFEPPIALDLGASVEFDTTVRCDEPAGLVTENAFVILYANWMNSEWRIYGRIRVTVNADALPETITESITYQKAGFSGLDQ
jgi:hypothetical protein